MYAVSPDGKRWHRLTDFKSGVRGTADGYTGPAFTPNGKKAVWSQIVDGNIFQYTFGRWELILADFEEKNGIPAFKNLKNITPRGMHWNEPGNFSPDGVSVLLSGSTERNAQGMDQIHSEHRHRPAEKPHELSHRLGRARRLFSRRREDHFHERRP